MRRGWNDFSLNFSLTHSLSLTHTHSLFLFPFFPSLSFSFPLSRSLSLILYPFAPSNTELPGPSTACGLRRAYVSGRLICAWNISALRAGVGEEVKKVGVRESL